MPNIDFKICVPTRYYDNGDNDNKNENTDNDNENNSNDITGITMIVIMNYIGSYDNNYNL